MDYRQEGIQRMENEGYRKSPAQAVPTKFHLTFPPKVE